MIRFFQLALWLCHWKTPAAEKLLRQATTLPRFVLAEKVAGPKKWVRKPLNISPSGAFWGRALQMACFRYPGWASFRQSQTGDQLVRNAVAIQVASSEDNAPQAAQEVMSF